MARKQIQILAGWVAAALLQGGAALGQTPTPTAEQVECNDGTVAIKAANACSDHGGIARRSGISSVPTTNPTPTPGSTPTLGSTTGTGSTTTGAAQPGTVLCKDGTSMRRAEGCCDNHGGPAGPMSPYATSPTSGKSGQGTGGSGSAGVAPTSSAGVAPANPAGVASTNPAGLPTDTAPQANESKATAQCKDGTLLYAPQSEGVCSDHGGLHQWLTGTSR